jgi:hypothetical protein
MFNVHIWKRSLNIKCLHIRVNIAVATVHFFKLSFFLVVIAAWIIIVEHCLHLNFKKTSELFLNSPNHTFEINHKTQ